MQRALINSNLVKVGMNAEKKEDVLKELSRLLTSKGYVVEEYLEAILEREKLFPTGLPTAGLGVAIPHADSKYVIKPGIAAAVLKDTVRFNVMGDPDNEVDVKLVFMLAIKDPKLQIMVLRELVSIFQDDKLLMLLSKAQDEDSFASLMNSTICADL